CDASLIEITENAAGEPLKLGRKSRTVSTALRRALAARDRGCRFPGCTNQRFLDAHHIQHWVDGGRTDLDNLVLLCRRHHRFLHEYGYSIVRIDRALDFRTADGRSVPQVPPPIETERGCERLRQAHEHAGLSIEHDTADSHWGGEAMDYHWVLQGLFEREQRPGLGPEYS
ncbi:MAG TPA: HNH endonuclease signature motif containing protein, partial [Polyangiales bacterium]|nr:HNH endonuclease signature motif containing protein [Polyangiales bacterium]